MRVPEGGGEGQQDAAAGPEGRRGHQGQRLSPGEQGVPDENTILGKYFFIERLSPGEQGVPDENAILGKYFLMKVSVQLDKECQMKIPFWENTFQRLSQCEAE
jgi:hypothetical protein